MALFFIFIISWFGGKRLGMFRQSRGFQACGYVRSYGPLFFWSFVLFFLLFFFLYPTLVCFFCFFFGEGKSLSFSEERDLFNFVKSECFFFENEMHDCDPWSSGLCLFVTLSLLHSLALLRCYAELLGPDCTSSQPQMLLRLTDLWPSLLGFPHTLLYAYTHSLILCEQTPLGNRSRVGIKTRVCPA